MISSLSATTRLTGADIDFDRAKEEPNAMGPIVIHLDTRPRRPYRSLHRVWEA